jgi:bifunctional NMN adenylyltransferase/nudix hydrolase
MTKLAVFIGRFSPFHNGHAKIVDTALKQGFDRVLILVGSANRPRSERNPFSFEERKNIIKTIYSDMRVIVEPLNDIAYNDQLWISQVQKAVANYQPFDDMVSLIGHKKDATSYYLNMFPQWNNVSVEPYHRDGIELGATYIRNCMYVMGKESLVSPMFTTGIIQQSTARLINGFDFSVATEEFHHNQKYKKQFESLPYPPIFQTCDAVVVQSGHVLLVERGAMPGKGLMALPGGFLNADERIVDGCIRELREETKLKVPEAVLRGSITKRETFDEPMRSGRGRTITTAVAIQLPNGPLPKVKGSDDAKKAFWKPISEIRGEDMFEDHYDIIQVMVGNREKLD